MNKLRLYLTILLTFFITMSEVEGSIDASAFVAEGGCMFTADVESIFQDDNSDTSMFTADEGNIFTTYNFTNAKRHVRTNLRRKLHNNGCDGITGNFYSYNYYILHGVYFPKDTSSPGEEDKDYVVLLRKLII